MKEKELSRSLCFLVPACFALSFWPSRSFALTTGSAGCFSVFFHVARQSTEQPLLQAPSTLDPRSQSAQEQQNRAVKADIQRERMVVFRSA
jgi:hypothetical protein